MNVYEFPKFELPEDLNSLGELQNQAHHLAEELNKAGYDPNISDINDIVSQDSMDERVNTIVESHHLSIPDHNSQAKLEVALRNAAIKLLDKKLE